LIRRSGILSVFLLSLSGCLYGFGGGGLPSHVKTFAISQFKNETATVDLPSQIADELRARVHERLGLTEAPDASANAIIRGTIQRYEIDIPVGVAANNKAATTATRALELTVDIEMVDQVSGKTLWQKKGLVAQAQYEERTEAAARAKAISQIVDQLIEGAQSQW
jgi:hypothetical protein